MIIEQKVSIESGEQAIIMLKKILHGTGVFISLLLITLATLLSFSISWMFKTWTNLSMDELVYHLTAPIEGTNEEMILNYLQSCLVPTILILLSVIIIYITFLKKKSFYLYIGSGSGIAIVVLIVALTYAWNQLDVGNYLKNQNVESDFIEQYYVNPEETVITFPEIKRNLIYIYLESMEVTYTDEKNGGAFDEDVIPELTQIAQDNGDFSGTDSKLNGGYAFPGTTWTMAAMFAQTSGLPLNVSIGQNNMDTQESFLPGITALGDILEQNGYSRTLMIGSDATFGGRALYFTDHGNYDLEDYNYAIEQGWIPSDYRVWWGYEDERLFQNAKNKLMELSAQEEPFNLTLLTVDTHFEDGYVCDICPDKFEENQYANVMACSSAQVADFINWIQQQDFYENTTIVISGDHPTMDSDFCDSVSEDYQRKVYTAILNSAVEPQLSERREFSTFDMFPTTLAAMGAKIEGERLGLGTNLFSKLPTLTERVGYEKEIEELQKRSSFIDNLANINEDAEELMKRDGRIPSAAVWNDEYDAENGVLHIHMGSLSGVNEEVSALRIKIWMQDDQSDLSWVDFSEQDENGVYHADVGLSTYDYMSGNYHIQAVLTYTSGTEYLLGDELNVSIE